MCDGDSVGSICTCNSTGKAIHYTCTSRKQLRLSCYSNHAPVLSHRHHNNNNYYNGMQRAGILNDPLPQMKHVFLSTSSLWSFSALRAAKGVDNDTKDDVLDDNHYDDEKEGEIKGRPQVIQTVLERMWRKRGTMIIK